MHCFRMALFSRRALASARLILPVNFASSPISFPCGIPLHFRCISDDNPKDGSNKKFPYSKNGRVSFVNTLGDQSKNPFNPNLYPEEVKYGDPLEGLSPVEEDIYKDIVGKINTQISEESYGRPFAVIHVSQRQYRVTEGDIIMVEHTFPLDVGERIKFEKVLAAGCADFSLIGRPILDRNLVDIEATCIEKSLAYPIIKFQHIKPLSLRRRRFFRNPETMIRINKITFKRKLNDLTHPDDVVHTIH
ncbi:39S ribosomal protein L21, mitochondrial-like [Paramacrobiotus metropolitanus]|uniref:39S ribosomal protein L21, mitochondrial-like n=1 Tax=Paramacrobiotus metropolitanus TaxID=2943436 RepID=UPI00244632CF|nr:39S ribosomal protein L21, mitochondrial-like [Paramacrobiotus metropolitanus]